MPELNKDIFDNCNYGFIFCRKGGACTLMLELNGQASNGGFQNCLGRGSAGPYWIRQVWDRYMERILDTATENNCVCREKLVDAIKNITEEKEAREEFFTKRS